MLKWLKGHNLIEEYSKDHLKVIDGIIQIEVYDQSKISWFKWLLLRSIMIVKYFVCYFPIFNMDYDDIKCSSGHCGRNLSLINHFFLLIALQMVAISFTNPFWIDDFVEPLMIHDAWPVTIPSLIMESLIR